MIDKRLIIVSGKGGVGKSALSAALALLAQRRGLRVLAMELGSPGGLSSHFATGPLEFQPREVRPGLHAMRMVRSDALLEYMAIQLGVRGIIRFGPVARAFDVLATTAPGIREIVTIGKAIWEVRADRWDVVIADAPPTGQIGSYLRAPQTVRELVPSGKVRAEADLMREALRDPSHTGLALVTIPEELPTTESKETLGWISDRDLVSKPTIIANRILNELAPGDAGSELVAATAELHRSLWAEQQEWLEALPPDIKIPYLFGVFTPGEVAAHLTDVLEDVL